MATTTKTSSLVVLAIATLATGVTTAPGVRLSASIQSGAGTAEQAVDPPRTLDTGARIERAFAPGETHTYLLALTTGQYAHLEIEQRGIDVVTTLISPSGQTISEFDSGNDVEGPEPIWVVAGDAGRFRLEVRALSRGAPAGRYAIRVEELRDATERDRRRVSAQRAQAEGMMLMDQESADLFRGAIPKYEEALTVWRELKETGSEQDTLGYLASVYQSLRENQKALDCYRELVSMFRASGNRRREALALTSIGWIHDNFGEYQLALDHYTQALTLLRTTGVRSPEATTLASMGLAYSRLGDWPHALEFYRQSLEVYRAIRNRNGEASALHGLGQVYASMGTLPQALDHFTEALPLFRDSGNRRREAQCLASLGWIHASMGDREKALSHLADALSRSRAIGDRGLEAQALHNLATVHDTLGDTARALAAYGEALPLRRSLGDRAGEASTLAGLARLERDRGQLAEARRHIDTALDRIESLRTAVARQELRSAYLASKQNEYELSIDILMRLHRQEPARGYDAAALEASERARARGLLEMLAEARADIRTGVDPALLERERLLQREINVRERARMQAAGGRPSQADAAVQRELEALLSAYQELQSQIRTTSPRYAALTQPRPLDAPAIRRLLDDGVMILEYALGEERSFLWSVTNTSLRSYELPSRAEIERSARRLFDLLRRGHERISRTQIDLAAEELSRIVLGPVARQLGRNRLLIVSDGVLQYVPFAILTDPASIGVPQQPLIVGHEIASLPSASTLALLREESRGRAEAPRTVAVLSDPVFDPADPRVAASAGRRPPDAPRSPGTSPGGSHGAQGLSDVERSAVESGVASFERLPFSRREANAIEALAPAGQAFKALDFAASRTTAASPDLVQYRIVHFATHALINSAHPELSGIVLSLVDERGHPQDGFLRAHEIYNLHLAAELVVLSGCQTALGQEVRGEGLVGLTRGFMYAGATRVVASLWNVKDAATSELMQRFYRGLLRDKLRPAAALRAAQISMWRESRWSAPYNWAGFVMQGE